MKTKIDRPISGYESAEIAEDEQNYYIDLRTGLGEAVYPKRYFSLDEAIADALNWKMQ